MHFIFQTRQIVAVPRTISQFHEFLNLIFGGFLKFATTVLQPIALNARAHEHTRVLRHSIIFVHAYNKVKGTKYHICKIELVCLLVCFKGRSRYQGIPQFPFCLTNQICICRVPKKVVKSLHTAGAYEKLGSVF